MTLEKYLNNRIEKALGRHTVLGDFVFLMEDEYIEIDGAKTRVSEPCVYMFFDDKWNHVEQHKTCPHCGKPYLSS